ncbi:MAG: hypothetical protein WCL35_00055 [bacterium]
MRSRVTKCAILAIALVAVASCGSSKSDSSGPDTTRVKNAALVTTTLASGTLPSKGSAGETPTTVAAATTTSAAPATTATTAAPATTLVPVPAAAVVADPGNYQATYLASDNPLGAPRPALPAEASLTSNAARAVSATWNTDSAGVLTVTKAEWVGTATPMTLRWTISTTSSGSLVCDNCAFVTTKAKSIIKEVTSQTLKGSGIKSIRGLDPTAPQVGAFLGNGWGVEFLLGDQTNDSAATGNAIRDLMLSCSGTTASTCKNVSLKVAELKWKNTLWSTSDCISALRNGGPSQLIDGIATALTGANADTAALVRARAALDRVAVATPAYRPVFNTSGTTRTLTGFASTGCAS